MTPVSKSSAGRIGIAPCSDVELSTRDKTGLAAARRWLLKSGIRGTGQNAGAIRRQYDLRSRHYAAFYPEVTAYALQLHLRLAGSDRENADWHAALESGDWLLRWQSNEPQVADGAFAHAISNGEASGGWYAFDTAVVGHGLLELAQATQRADFTRAAERCAEWVLTQQHADGSFRAAAGAANAVPWAFDRCCLHGKHALLLGAMWHHSRELRYRNGAHRLLDWLMGLQQESGRIDAYANADFSMLHTQCYAIEGLMSGALRLEHSGAMRAAARAVRHLASCQRRSGAMPRYVGSGSYNHLKIGGAKLPRLRVAMAPGDVGVTVQTIRLWNWARSLWGDDYSDAITRAMAWVSRQQIISNDIDSNGGFPAGVDEYWGLRRREPRLYPWVNMFAVDAWRMQAEPPVAPDIF